MVRGSKKVENRCCKAMRETDPLIACAPTSQNICRRLHLAESTCIYSLLFSSTTFVLWLVIIRMTGSEGSFQKWFAHLTATFNEQMAAGSSQATDIYFRLFAANDSLVGNY